jgi:D-alanine-D-alanine ligase
MTEKRLKLGVIFGGRSGEHEVSLMSARSVLSVLDPARYAVTQIGISHEGAWYTGDDVLGALSANRLDGLTPTAILPDPTLPGLYAIHSRGEGLPPSPTVGRGVGGEGLLELLTALDVVFPVLHGTFGEDGTLQGLLEMADIAYVGAGVLGSAVGMDKGVFQAVMVAQGIPVLETMVALRSEIESHIGAVLEHAEKMAPYPLFTKPANLGSSVGVSKCWGRSDLLEGLMEASRYDRRVLIQRGVNGREIEVSVLGNDAPEASIPGEVIPSREFYSYESKYIDNTSELLIPAPIPAEIADRVRQLAVQAYVAVDCAGMARADFLLDRDPPGDLYLNEINTIPGFTQISMYPKLWEASGLPYPALVDRLIELALERKAQRDRTERRYSDR